VLVVDDDHKLIALVRMYLEREGFTVVPAYDGRQALDLFARHRPGFVILDVMLPEMDGVAVCRALRKRSEVPILMLTARVEESDKLSGLGVGADDYVTKPFSVLELAARARAQLRRARTASPATPSPITIHGLTIDPVTRRVERDGRQIHLTPIEWQILSTLVNAGGRTLTHQQIFDAVWSRQFGSPQQYLRVHITNLRRKIESDPASPRIVITEPGVGYRADVVR
jgi:DNA-binding response OmpR family regulator